ncbi:hypothetical protein HK105_204318 [Polyrhizophydium stewartii]|uniref:Uncharacterized protein n=1 Tax=Polyrhizophydium stewartii TaxID=2732419 RepID=A0ABR4N9P7_9FUNG
MNAHRHPKDDGLAQLNAKLDALHAKLEVLSQAVHRIIAHIPSPAQATPASGGPRGTKRRQAPPPVHAAATPTPGSRVALDAAATTAAAAADADTLDIVRAVAASAVAAASSLPATARTVNLGIDAAAPARRRTKRRFVSLALPPVPAGDDGTEQTESGEPAQLGSGSSADGAKSLEVVLGALGGSASPSASMSEHEAPAATNRARYKERMGMDYILSHFPKQLLSRTVDEVLSGPPELLVDGTDHTGTSSLALLLGLMFKAVTNTTTTRIKSADAAKPFQTVLDEIKREVKNEGLNPVLAARATPAEIAARFKISGEPKALELWPHLIRTICWAELVRFLESELGVFGSMSLSEFVRGYASLYAGIKNFIYNSVSGRSNKPKHDPSGLEHSGVVEMLINSIWPKRKRSRRSSVKKTDGGSEDGEQVASTPKPSMSNEWCELVLPSIRDESQIDPSIGAISSISALMQELTVAPNIKKASTPFTIACHALESLSMRLTSLVDSHIKWKPKSAEARQLQDSRVMEHRTQIMRAWIELTVRVGMGCSFSEFMSSIPSALQSSFAKDRASTTFGDMPVPAELCEATGGKTMTMAEAFCNDGTISDLFYFLAAGKRCEEARQRITEILWRTPPPTAQYEQGAMRRFHASRVRLAHEIVVLALCSPAAIADPSVQELCKSAKSVVGIVKTLAEAGFFQRNGTDTALQLSVAPVAGPTQQAPAVLLAAGVPNAGSSDGMAVDTTSQPILLDLSPAMDDMIEMALLT